MKCGCTHRRCRLRNRFPNSQFLLDIVCCHDSSSAALRYHPVDIKTLAHRQQPKLCKFIIIIIIWYDCIYSARVFPRSCGANEMVHDSPRSSTAEIFLAIFLRFDLKRDFLQRFRSRPTWHSFHPDKEDVEFYEFYFFFNLLNLIFKMNIPSLKFPHPMATASFPSWLTPWSSYRQTGEMLLVNLTGESMVTNAISLYLKKPHNQFKKKLLIPWFGICPNWKKITNLVASNPLWRVILWTRLTTIAGSRKSTAPIITVSWATPCDDNLESSKKGFKYLH